MSTQGVTTDMLNTANANARIKVNQETKDENPNNDDVNRIARLVVQLRGLPSTHPISGLFVIASLGMCIYYTIEGSESFDDNVGKIILVIFLIGICGIATGILSNMMHKVEESLTPGLTINEKKALENEPRYRIFVWVLFLVSLGLMLWQTIEMDSKTSGGATASAVAFIISVVLYSLVSRQRANATNHIDELLKDHRFNNKIAHSTLLTKCCTSPYPTDPCCCC